MDNNTPWSCKVQALTHILTSPTYTPSLHSQFFISHQIPCYLNWDYPPILCPNPSILKKWNLSFFFRRLFRLGVSKKSSWRSKCPYQQPPPVELAKGVEEAKWGEEERREYVRKRLSRKRLFTHVNPLLPVVLPNLVLFSLLLWKPFQD